ncbi:MAG: hypothetical protein AB1791_12720 [Chloroflexota bacterium]
MSEISTPRTTFSPLSLPPLPKRKPPAAWPYLLPGFLAILTLAGLLYFIFFPFKRSAWQATLPGRLETLAARVENMENRLAYLEAAAGIVQPISSTQESAKPSPASAKRGNSQEEPAAETSPMVQDLTSLISKIESFGDRLVDVETKLKNEAGGRDLRRVECLSFSSEPGQEHTQEEWNGCLTALHDTLDGVDARLIPLERSPVATLTPPSPPTCAFGDHPSTIEVNGRVDLIIQITNWQGQPGEITLKTDRGGFETPTGPSPSLPLPITGDQLQAVFLAGSEPGTATITADAAGLTCPPITIEVEPAVQLTLTLTPTQVEAGQPFTVIITATSGDQPVADGTMVTLQADPADLVSFDSAELTLVDGTATTVGHAADSVESETEVTVTAELPDGNKSFPIPFTVIPRPLCRVEQTNYDFAQASVLYRADDPQVAKKLFGVPAGTGLVSPETITNARGVWPVAMYIWVAPANLNEGRNALINIADSKIRFLVGDPNVSEGIGQEDQDLLPNAEGYSVEFVCEQNGYVLVRIVVQALTADIDYKEE